MRGALTIGLIPTVTAVDAPAALAEFHRAHPAVKIGLRGGGSNEFISEILAGHMDVAVLGLPEHVVPEGVASRELVREKFVAVVAESHSLAGRRGLSLRDISDETFVDFPVSTPGRAQSDLAFAAAGVQREVAFEVMDLGIVLELVRHGLVIALLSPALVAGVPGLATVELLDGPGRVEYLAWGAFNPSPAALAFLAYLNSASPQRRRDGVVAP